MADQGTAAARDAIPKTAVETDTETYFRILLHDDRNSFYIVSTRDGNTWHDSAYKGDALRQLDFSGHADCYITHNGFTDQRRRSLSVRQLNALFFDIDCHGSQDDLHLGILIDRGIQRIEDAVSNGELPRPNLLVCSGRGIHLYYVLERSVPYRFKGNGSINEKGIKLYKKVQSQLADILEEIIGGLEGLEVDRSVFDASRVARIPGTYNTRAACQAYLLSHHEEYHHLSDLASYLPHKRNEETPDIRTATILNFNPLMMSRLNKVSELQRYRNYDCEGNRELMCFVFYNTAVQIYARADAAERLVGFNGRFQKPLPPTEIENITRAVDTVKNVKGQVGHYILGAMSLTRLLALTEKEIDDLSFFASKKMQDRLEAKRKTKERRDARNKRILELYWSGSYTQQDIAEAVGCSIRTVQGVLKDKGLTRGYKRPETTSEAIPAATLDVAAGAESMVADRFSFFEAKAQKNARRVLECSLGSGFPVDGLALSDDGVVNMRCGWTKEEEENRPEDVSQSIDGTKDGCNGRKNARAAFEAARAAEPERISGINDHDTHEEASKNHYFQK